MFSTRDAIPITTIDEEKTRRREDGFYVDLLSKEIYVTILIPDRSLCFFDRVADAIQRQEPKASKLPFFKPEERGLSQYLSRDVLTLKISPPSYRKGALSLEKAKIRRVFSFEQADNSNVVDEELAFFRKYAEEEKQQKVSTEELVAFANWKINDSALVAMRNLNLPRLFHNRGKVSMQEGYCRVNRPLRDAVSLINMFQLVHFMEEGRVLFNWNEMRRFVPHS